MYLLLLLLILLYVPLFFLLAKQRIDLDETASLGLFSGLLCRGLVAGDGHGSNISIDRWSFALLLLAIIRVI